MQTQKQIAVLGSFLTSSKSVDYQMAEELGYLLARNGFKVICGGHGGIAVPLASGVRKGGGRICGISLPESRYPSRSAKTSPDITETVQVETLPERLEALAGANGYVVFTGGIGTLAEIAFIWHSLQIEGDFERPIVFLSRSWSRFLANFKHDQMAKFKYYKHVYICEHVKDAVAIVTQDYSLKYDDPLKFFHKECVLFDLDGTIVEALEEQFVKSCENIGHFFQMSDVLASFEKYGTRHPKDENEIGLYVNILKSLGLTTGAATEIAEYLCTKSEQIPELYSDAAEILHYFKNNGFATGVVSSRSPLQVNDILSAHNLSHLVDISCPLNQHDMQQLRSVLEDSGFPMGDVIYVGDNLEYDYLSSRAINLDSILLDRHLNYLSDDNAFKVRSLRELKYFIQPLHV